MFSNKFHLHVRVSLELEPFEVWFLTIKLATFYNSTFSTCWMGWNPLMNNTFHMLCMSPHPAQLFTMQSDFKFFSVWQVWFEFILYHWLNLSRFSDLNDVVYLKSHHPKLYNLINQATVNFLLTPNEQLDFMTLKEAIPMPMFWLNETMKLDAGTTEDMYQKSIKPLKITTSLQYSLFAIGGLLVVIGIVDGYRTSKQGNSSLRSI